MNNAIQFINSEGLTFFGSVNASISHELKNILAIVSETAGFINDLTGLAKQGKDMNLSLLENCSDSIAEEIQRGFTTLKQMNKFAHSMDTPIRETDLIEVLDLAVNLSGYLSFASRLHINTSHRQIKPVLTCPFLLLNLIYKSLCFAYTAAGPEGQVHIRFNTREMDGMHLIFSSPNPLALDAFWDPKIQQTAEILGVENHKAGKATELDLWIPYASTQIDMLAKQL